MTQPAEHRPLLMTSCEVYDVIERIAAAKGKAKETLLAEYIDDQMMRTVLTAAYDPFRTYGIKQVPESDVAGAESFSDHTIELLDKLARRELTGNAAKQAILDELAVLSDESKTLLTRILKKDLRAGFTAGTCNRVEPGFIFVFECMLAHKFEEKRIKAWPVAAEPKYDGVRSLAIWDGQEVIFYSRTGRVFEGMAPIANAIGALFEANKVPPMVLDGELMDKTNQFNKIVGDVHKKDFAANDAVYYLFDALLWENFQADDDKRTYRERRMMLSKLAEDTGLVRLPNVKVTPVRVMKSLAQIEDWAAEIMKAGGEGLIVKPLNGRYEKKRSYGWLKIKGLESADCEIIDFEEGEGKYEGMLGKLVVDFKGVQVGVGTGTNGSLPDSLRASLWEEYLKHGADQDWMGRLAEIQFHEVTPDGSLRHPRFVRLRDDKPVEDGHGV